jgi:hypothetical protein
MRKGWLDTRRATLQEVFFEFKRRFPFIAADKMTGQLWRQVLAGDLIPIKMGGRQMFELWPRADVSQHLKEWNVRVATECRVIPPVKNPEDKEELKKLADSLNIAEPLVLAGDGPRKFA